MKRLIIQPEGWPCRFEELRPGYFVMGEDLFLKTEYGEDAYCDTGESFAGGASSNEERAKLMVQPVEAVWMEFEE